jgi:ribonuclease T1
MLRSSFLKWVLAGVICTAGMASGLATAKTPVTHTLEVSIAVADLPPQGSQMYQRIHQGGPFVSEKDGVVFGNRERLLPVKKRGFYREYTVLTPGLKHRGVKRIVCGGELKIPEICYYSDDHYASFRKIAP